MKKQLFSVLFSAVMLVSSLQLTQAIAVVNHYFQNSLFSGKVMRWHDKTKFVYVTLQPAKGIKGYKTSYDQIVKEAFGQWQAAIGNKMQFVFTNDPKLTDITVKWRAASDGLEIGNQGVLYRNGSNVFTNADITLSTYAPGNRLMGPSELKWTALHEIGHALGIKGHSPVATDVMATSLNPAVLRLPYNKVGLTSRDLATIQQIYKSKAQITNPVGAHLLGYRQFEYHVRLARNSYTSKNYQRAMELFQKAYGYYPSDSEINFYLGLSAYYAKRLDISVKHLEKQLAIGGKLKPTALLYLGSALEMQGSLEIAKGAKASGLAKLKRAYGYCKQVAQLAGVTAQDKKDSQTQAKQIGQKLAKLGVKAA